ncbi:hypothetical protein CAL7716_101550 (plasmid) [Calothrix sp. PCC 7716]|nr:hypothetical protein CAL7716_101550 [Calothrix sp. PCC 7716]
MQPDGWEKMEYDEFLGRCRVLIAGVIRFMGGEAVWLGGHLIDVAPIFIWLRMPSAFYMQEN